MKLWISFASILFTYIALLHACILSHSKQGYKLTSHQYNSLQNIDLITCLMECSQQPIKCQSINYKVGESICEMNNRTRISEPADFIHDEYWLYFDNPYRGAMPSIPGKSCKDILNNFPQAKLANQEYWIDPGNSKRPFSVYCDMETDGGGWTLIAQSVIQEQNETMGPMLRSSSYRDITNYTTKTLRIDVPAILALRHLISFSQLRFQCFKKIPGRTFHIITKRNTDGDNVIRYFTEDRRAQVPSCNSYSRGPGDTSYLASNCNQWGDGGKWGYFQHNGTYRIYNEPAYWNNDTKEYHVNFIPRRLCCDEDRKDCGFLHVGDYWKIFVK